VDNASVDGSVEAVRELYPNITLIENKENVGFSKANNQAFKIATGKYVLILNPDTLLQNDTLQKCILYMEAHNNVGALGVKMIDGNGKYLKESKRGLPTIANSFFKFSGLHSFFPHSKLINGYYAGHVSDSETNEIEVLTGAFFFTRRNILDQLNGFDEDFFMYGEDIDLSKRVLDLEHKIVYLADTKIVHFKGESTKKASISYVTRFYNAMGIYFSKHSGSDGIGLASIFIKSLIFFFGVFAFVKGFVKLLIRPLLDFAIVFLSFIGVKLVWATYFYHDPDYFSSSHFTTNAVIYALSIITSSWYFGWYDANKKIKYFGVGLLLSLMVILLIYALLPLEYRPSRAIIFLGLALSSLGILTFDLLIRSVFVNEKSDKKVIIVAKESNAKIIEKYLFDAGQKFKILGLVNPTTADFNQAYINDIDHLPSLIGILSPDEIIFSLDDLSMTTILNLMSFPSKNISYKITKKGQAIIGSDKPTERGQIYEVESKYHLARPLYIRIKRSFDVCGSLVLLLLFPLLIFSGKYRSFLFSGILFIVITGRFTLVSYNDLVGSLIKPYVLPPIKKGVFSTKHLIGQVINDVLLTDEVESAHAYAKGYTPFLDLEIVWKELW
jgi:GT2 family glycosyltransferase